MSREDVGYKMSYYSRMSKPRPSCLPTLIAILFITLVFLLFILGLFKLTFPTCSHECVGKVVQEYEYKMMRRNDVNGRDLIHVQSSDLSYVQKVCDMFDECSAYNSNGWLKTSAIPQDSTQSDLYVKQIPSSTDNVKKSQFDSQTLSDYNEMKARMKIFIYQTEVGTQHRPRRVGGYAVERQFVESLLTSQFVTQNANEATFFFIPIRCSSYILDATSEHIGTQHARQFVNEILEEIKNNYPYWAWSNGADHFYICAHDIGAGIGDGILKNVIALVNTADYEDPYFIPHKDISLPPTLSPGLSKLVQWQGGLYTKASTRDVLAFFAGDMTSGRIRPSIWNRWSHDKDIILFDHQLSEHSYTNYLKTSKYCLIIRGREAWSPRLIESVLTGCIPVIISNHYHLPLQGLVHWEEFSVIVPESEVSQLKIILQRIPSQKLIAMQDKLKEVYQHFVWNKPARNNDAFYSVMLQLWQRRCVVRYKSIL